MADNTRNGLLAKSVLAVTLAALLACVGCGDSDDNQGAGGTTNTSAGGNGGVGGKGGANPSGGGGQAGNAQGGNGQGGAIDPLYFEEVAGVVAVEAEHFITNDAQSAPRAWYLTTPQAPPDVSPDPDPPHADSASGSACLEGLPDTRVTDADPIMEGASIYNNAGTGPELSYRVYFNNPGLYYVWVRAYSTGGEDNGIHVAIDGVYPESGQKLQFCAGKNKWTWSSAKRDSDGPCGAPKTIFVEVPSAGEHTISFSMREDGFEFDKFIMASSTRFEPEDAGPPEKIFGR